MPSEPGLLARGPWDGAQVQTAWRDDTFDAGPDAEAEADAAIAALRERGSPSHDGLGGRLASYGVNGATLHLELQPARWALRLAPDAYDSMTVLCVVRGADGHWLAGRRADWVASWAGRWALGAGGSVEVGENPVATLSRELAEEWSVAPERLTVEALVRLPSGLVSLIGLARLPAGAEAVPDPEHDALAWWPPDPGDWPDDAHPALRRVAELLAGA
ncbi:MAG TPA: NUDIX domain-containing protein [Solirubrobacteraceae bacterium]